MPRRTLPIRQRRDGAWEVRYRDASGRQRSTTKRSEAAARRFLTETRADLARGVWIDPNDASTTFRTYAEDWRQRQIGAYGTRVAIENSLRVHWYPLLGNVPLERLRPSMLQGAVRSLEGRLAASTIHTVVQHLRQVLNGAVADRMIATNPADGLKLPRVERSELVIPSPEQVAAIAVAIDDRHRALVVVGAGLGLRQGEAFGLSRDRVDFLRRRVTIDRQLVREEHGSTLGPLKTSNSYRTIPLPSWAGDELARHLERYPNDDPDGLLFVAPMGGRLRRDGWNRRVWKPAVTAAGRAELGYHSLRHFYASALIRRGLQAPVVAERLGNTAAMVWDTYAHLWKDDDDRTREAIDELFGRRAS